MMKTLQEVDSSDPQQMLQFIVERMTASNEVVQTHCLRLLREKFDVVTCPECNGTGVKSEESINNGRCHGCGGKGKVDLKRINERIHYYQYTPPEHWTVDQRLSRLGLWMYAHEEFTDRL